MAPMVAKINVRKKPNTSMLKIGQLAAKKFPGNADEDVGENAVTGIHHPSGDPSREAADDQHREESDAGLAHECLRVLHLPAPITKHDRQQLRRLAVAVALNAVGQCVVNQTSSV